MGIELELLVLLVLQTVSTSLFDRFEVETPAWRKLLRWTIAIGGTVGLYRWVGHYALLFPAGLALLGAAAHCSWCRRHGIHPLAATPRRRYYELRGWDWVE
ncbi:MAG TPA: hypothetical protein VFG08_02685 [Candidatus Polarisedimenticolia bacterium]|nr:hypothetical protein [Candidatus Polarisedimenticolia bacterium]